MPKTYTRLAEDERYQIYEGIAEKRLHRKIATLINKHHSTVSKEVKRKRRLKSGVRVCLTKNAQAHETL
jgi:IS30 family transposase